MTPPKLNIAIDIQYILQENESIQQPEYEKKLS